MGWREELVERISQQPCRGYGDTDSVATEPSALAALALAGEGRFEALGTVARWLGGIQRPNGSVGVRASEPEPCWPTSLAVLVWIAAERWGNDLSFAGARNKAIDWILTHRGETITRDEVIGHDTELSAWPWVAGTHAWVEPTALHVLALKAAGLTRHTRTRDAVRMLVDRQLPHGGWNYGNTFVLGRELRFHLQPTSMALLALATEPQVADSLTRSLDLLRRSVTPTTTIASLAWACLALAAHGQEVTWLEDRLEAGYERIRKRQWSLHKSALLLLALQRADSALVALPQASLSLTGVSE